MPQISRNSLAVDYTLKGYKFTFEGIYTKVIRDLLFQQVNKTDNPTYFSYDVNHEMPIYSGNIDTNFSNAYMLSNTSKGYRYSLTGMVSKSYTFGFNFMAAYTYGNAKDITNGVRNSMESNWQMNQSLTPNNPQLATSNFNIKHRIVSNVGYAVNITKNNTLSANVFFNAQSGNPYTWGFVNTSIAGTGQAAGLAYIFKDAAEAAKYIGTVSGGVFTSDPAQVAAYENFINSNEYLSSRRGKFTERNGAFTPWNIQTDMRIMDEFRIKDGKDNIHTIQFSISIINVGNMINKDWGRSYFVPNTFNSTANIGLTKHLIWLEDLMIKILYIHLNTNFYTVYCRSICFEISSTIRNSLFFLTNQINRKHEKVKIISSSLISFFSRNRLSTNYFFYN